MNANQSIEIELSPEVAEALRRGHQQITNDCAAVEEQIDPQDDWNEVLLPPPSFLNADQLLTINAPPVSTIHKKRDDIDDQISITAPVSLPLLVIELKNLVGYNPSSIEEAKLLENQVRGALFGRTTKYDLAFEELEIELFEASVAQHSDTQQWEQIVAQCDVIFRIALEYPDYICDTTSSTSRNLDLNSPKDSRSCVFKTSHIWKRLIKPHPIPVVAKLLQHLSTCNRALLWKYKMHPEILELARVEEDARVERDRVAALKEWRLRRRKEELEKLYEVRETFLHRLELAEAKLNSLEKERDQLVGKNLCLQRLETGKTVGLQAFDFGSTVFAFSDNNFIGLPGPSSESSNFVPSDDDYDLEYCDGFSDHDGDESFLYDVEETSSGCEVSSQISPTVINKIEANKSFDSTLLPCQDRRQKRQNAAQKRRQRLEMAFKETEHDSRLQAAKQEEDDMKQACCTPELLKATAVVKSMNEKLEMIDKLLETMQEEEWQDEEDNLIDAHVQEQEVQLLSNTTDISTLSLLDQILAMILGSKTCFEGNDRKNFVRDLQEIHLSIISGWKLHFGRLPPGITTCNKEVQQTDISLKTKHTHQEVSSYGDKQSMQMDGSSQQTSKEAFGIKEQGYDDWENASINDDDRDRK